MPSRYIRNQMAQAGLRAQRQDERGAQETQKYQRLGIGLMITSTIITMVFAAALFLVVTSQAQASPLTPEYCKSLAETSEIIAVRRDQGIPQERVVEQLHGELIEEQKTGKSGFFKEKIDIDRFIAIVVYVYQKKPLTAEVAGKVWDACKRIGQAAGKAAGKEVEV